MLNIYYGRESIEKEKFLYETVREEGFGPERPVIVLVPDQYTLEAERQAFRFLRVQSMVGLNVYGFSRLGHSLLQELGGSREAYVDKYGRQMLLTKIAAEEEENLEVFRDSVKKAEFLALTNDFISQMKQYGVTPAQLAEMVELAKEKPLLSAKLRDLQRIYARYQEAIEGKYTDSEDQQDLVAQKIRESERIRQSRIWVYGFDSFAPKSLDILACLMAQAESVNVVLTMDRNCPDEELFNLTYGMRGTLQGLANENGCPIGEIRKILPEENGKDYRCAHKSEAVQFLEQELYAVGAGAFEGVPEGVTLLEAGNVYSEAESAAAYVQELLRDHGLRRRDITLICNDTQTRAPIIKRVFEEHGLELFIDTKRSIADSGLAVLLSSLLTAVYKRYRSSDIFRVLKTGLTGIPTEAVEKLEDYVLKYRITGMRWKSEFTYGVTEYGTDGMEALNALREQVVAMLEGMEAICRGKQTNAEFTEKYYHYLVEGLGVQSKLTYQVRAQEAAGLPDVASAASQLWNVAMHLFDQITELIGDLPFRTETYRDLLSIGFSSMEVGILPTSVDDLMLGTMQRSRSRNVRAMLILGANEGLLPQDVSDGGLFSEEELEELADRGQELCKLDRVRMAEERLAIYRMFAKPSEYLYVSYADSDAEGKETRPSELVETLRELFPALETQRDILSRADELPMIDSEEAVLRHLTCKMDRAKRHNEPAGPIWMAAHEWFAARRPETLRRVEEGIRYANRPQKLSARRAELLFKMRRGERTLSPSRLEGYSHCPFSYFTKYGLNPGERRVYEAGIREIGDLYHDTVMAVTQQLSAQNLWATATEADCERLVKAAVEQEKSNYREGLFSFSGRETYRVSRLEDACIETVKALLEQARAGAIQESKYEIAFGFGQELEPVTIDLGTRKVYLTGRIDRMDVLENGRIKIIDYKSGNREILPKDATDGYSLQLMLYLEAAEEERREPAGIFYFHIQEPRVRGLMEPAKIAAEVRKNFRLNGLLVDEEETVRQVAGDIDKGESSAVVNLKKKKDGKWGDNKVLLSESEFANLEAAVGRKVQDICRRMDDGEVAIRPMYLIRKKTSVCKYCDYKGICRFDEAYEGNKYLPVGEVTKKKK